jgi:uncharacterized membrane protein YesL
MFIESRIYSTLVFVSNVFLLNLLWLLFCLPLITAFPATAALFGAVRHWKIHKDVNVFSSFLRCFKENFKQSFTIGLGWALCAGFLIADYSISLKLGSLKMIISPLLLAVGFFFFIGSVFLIPMMVQFKMATKSIVMNSMLLSISYFPFSLIISLLLGLLAIGVYIFPVSLLVIGCLGAYSIYYLSDIVFKKVNHRQNAQIQINHIDVMDS